MVNNDTPGIERRGVIEVRVTGLRKNTSLKDPVFIN